MDEHAHNTQEEQVEHVCSDIVIWCHPKNVGNLVEAFHVHIRNAAFPAFVLWSGLSGGLHMGIVVIEWEGDVSGAFLHDLRRDFEIVDFVVYDWVQALQERENQGVETRDESLMEQWQATLENMRMYLNSVTQLQYLPQEGSINALLQACERLNALVPRLQQRIDPHAFHMRFLLQNLPEQLAPVETAAVLLKQACETCDHPCPLVEILKRQLGLRKEGQTFLPHVTAVQNALQEFIQPERTENNSL